MTDSNERSSACALDLDAVGYSSKPIRRVWSQDECILYSLAVGAGRSPEPASRRFTTEVDQVVLPTFGVHLTPGMSAVIERIGPVTPGSVVHAGQAVTLHDPLPAWGEVVGTSAVVGIRDLGRHALIETESSAVDLATGKVLVTTTADALVRGAGGFGGPRPDDEDARTPDRAPDFVAEEATVIDQSLLFRLLGDKHPLHHDANLAVSSGFRGPILHGLCTFGVVGRILAGALDKDPARLVTLSTRFTGVVYPGETLTVKVWSDHNGSGRFTTSSDGREVLRNGHFSFSPAVDSNGS